MDSSFERYEKQAEILKVLGHPVRLCIVRGLLDKGKCNVSYMQECMLLPQSSVSTHLQKLKSVGIIESERNGLEIIYHLKNETVKEMLKILFSNTRGGNHHA